jgi:hypothetical protein
MLFQPAIIALLLASGAGVLMLAAAAPFAVETLRHWDIRSGSERQLRLERRTYLVSTLLAVMFVVQLLALLLFVFNADRMAVMFVGAMCAVGTLNVNAYGFPALLAQIALFFLASTWLVVNHADNRARDYPLLRAKYTFLLVIVPVAAASFALQLNYFLGLKADVITSCCGSLFSGEGRTLAAETSGLPPMPAMTAFFASLALTAGIGYLRAARSAAPLLGYAVAAAAAVAFIVAIAGILSFLSLYIYEHPHHHCPFCALKADYHHRGYWLYVPLFAATAAGLGVGALQPFAGIASLKAVLPALTRWLAMASALLYCAFALVALVMIWTSNLKLIET